MFPLSPLGDSNEIDTTPFFTVAITVESRPFKGRKYTCKKALGCRRAAILLLNNSCNASAFKYCLYPATLTVPTNCFSLFGFARAKLLNLAAIFSMDAASSLFVLTAPLFVV